MHQGAVLYSLKFEQLRSLTLKHALLLKVRYPDIGILHMQDSNSFPSCTHYLIVAGLSYSRAAYSSFVFQFSAPAFHHHTSLSPHSLGLLHQSNFGLTLDLLEAVLLNLSLFLRTLYLQLSSPHRLGNVSFHLVSTGLALERLYCTFSATTSLSPLPRSVPNVDLVLAGL